MCYTTAILKYMVIFSWFEHMIPPSHKSKEIPLKFSLDDIERNNILKWNDSFVCACVNERGFKIKIMGHDFPLKLITLNHQIYLP